MVVVHAIFIATNIEFSRLIGDYLPAKFELLRKKYLQFSFKYNKSEEGILGIGNTDDTHEIATLSQALAKMAADLQAAAGKFNTH